MSLRGAYKSTSFEWYVLQIWEGYFWSKNYRFFYLFYFYSIQKPSKRVKKKTVQPGVPTVSKIYAHGRAEGWVWGAPMRLPLAHQVSHLLLAPHLQPL